MITMMTITMMMTIMKMMINGGNRMAYQDDYNAGAFFVVPLLILAGYGLHRLVKDNKNDLTYEERILKRLVGDLRCKKR